MSETSNTDKEITAGNRVSTKLLAVIIVVLAIAVVWFFVSRNSSSSVSLNQSSASQDGQDTGQQDSSDDSPTRRGNDAQCIEPVEIWKNGQRTNTLRGGDTFQAKVVMENTGTTIWDQTDFNEYVLGSYFPMLNDFWGLREVPLSDYPIFPVKEQFLNLMPRLHALKMEFHGEKYALANLR